MTVQACLIWSCAACSDTGKSRNRANSTAETLFEHCARHLYPVPASPGQGLAVGRGTGNPPRTRLIVGMYVPGFALTACCLSNDTPLLSTAQPFPRWQRAESRQFSDRRRVMRCLTSQKYTHRNPLCSSSLATWVLAWASNTGLLEP